MAMTNGTSKGCDCAFSRGAATECSPGRKPGVGVVLAHQPRRCERVFRPYGAELVSKENPGLAPGATLCRRSAAVHGGPIFSANSCALERLEDRTALHDEADTADCGNFLGGISVDGDQVRQKPGLYAADQTVHVKDAGIDRCRRAKRVNIGHAPGDHGLELARVLTMRKNAHVASGRDGNSSLKSGLEAGFLGFRLSSDGYSRTICHSALLH